MFSICILTKYKSTVLLTWDSQSNAADFDLSFIDCFFVNNSPTIEPKQLLYPALLSLPIQVARRKPWDKHFVGAFSCEFDSEMALHFEKDALCVMGEWVFWNQSRDGEVVAGCLKYSFS